MQWVLFVHIVLGALWLGGVIYQETLVSSAHREGREAYIRVAVRTALNNARIYPIVTILLMASAAWLIIARDYLDWGDGWIIAASTLWVIGLALGIAYFTPVAKKLTARLEAEGPTAELGTAVDKMLRVARADIILLLALLFLMVFKPGL